MQSTRSHKILGKTIGEKSVQILDYTNSIIQ